MASNEEQSDTQCTKLNGNAVEHKVTSNGDGSIDEGDVIGFNFGRSRSKGPCGVSTIERDAWFYKMNHKHRGLALIFNHEHFNADHLKSRTGTKADFENLKNSLSRLGFFVKPYNDLTYTEILSALDEATAQDYTELDCLFIAILSHGEEGVLHAKDTPYKPNIIFQKFTAEKCITLAGKPKLFFIQACQGDGLDAGVTMRTQVDGTSNTYRIPSHADFLIAYSTIPGFYSWRNTQKGSWFVQALCEELNTHSYSLDLLAILTFVVQKVAFHFESNVPNDYQMHAKKQIPCFTSMLTRLLKFEPPLSSI